MSHGAHGGGGGSSSSEPPIMTFLNSETTNLFGAGWTPTTTAGYAGTCIFLILLAMLARGLVAIKSVLEQRWLDAARSRRYVVVADQTPMAERVAAADQDPDSKTSMLVSAQGVEERVRVVQRRAGPPVMAWRFSTDLPRAALVAVTAGVGYLLMLAVMTMNVGYFLSILGGVFLGELAVGRFVGMEEH